LWNDEREMDLHKALAEANEAINVAIALEGLVSQAMVNPTL
jgi:hypothetical protein